jgi:hypothetical protein
LGGYYGSQGWQESPFPAAVEDYLLEQRLSNSCRNTILYTLKLVMQKGIIETIPDFEPFKRHGRQQDVLSGEELTKLFPYDEEDLIRIWTLPSDKRKEGDENLVLMFATLFWVTVSVSLYSEEIWALHRERWLEWTLESPGLVKPSLVLMIDIPVFRIYP